MELFSYIPFVPDRKTVIRRLGAQRAKFPADLDHEINAMLKSAESLFTVKGKAVSVPISVSAEGMLFINGMPIESKQLKKLLTNSTEAYLMCTSVPAREVDKINQAIKAGEGLKAIVYDAYASEFVDGALDVIVSKKNASLIRSGRRLTHHRFSAGYGDLDIRYQKVFYDMLEMGTLGVTLNEQFLLSPEKSVIAVAGVE